MLLIGIASKNPVKINAAKAAANKLWKNSKVMSHSISGSISHMPYSKEETRIGAKSRAKQLMEQKPKYDLTIGNEGGICKIEHNWYLFSATFAFDGKEGSWGTETLIRLSEEISSMIETSNEELGKIIDEITGKENTKQKFGAVGYLTDNYIMREDIFLTADISALSYWKNQFD